MRFLLVDRIDALEEGRRIVGARHPAMSEDVFTWHFPERPIVPGTLILEAFVQLAGWLEAASTDFASWFLLEGVRTARYQDFAGPGDVLTLDLERMEDAEASDGRRVYRGESRKDGKRNALVEFEGRVVPLADLEDPEGARRIFAALWRGKGEAS